MVSEIPKASEVVVLVPSAKLGRVIGKGGSTIRSIEKETGAHCDCDNSSSRGEDGAVVRISGSYEQVCAARDVIIGVLSHRTETLQVAEHQISTVIGRKGQTISYIQRVSNASVRSNNRKGSTPNTVTIQGSKAEVAAARKLIEEAAESTFTCRVQRLQPWQVKAVIGKNGAVAAAIQSRSLAQLHVSGDEIMLTGTAPQAELARRMVAAVVAATKYATVPIQATKARLIIGRGGSTISAIRSESGAWVELDGDDAVCIWGLSAQVERALLLVENALSSETEKTMTIEPEQGGLILGKSGATISRLQKESGTRIHVEASPEPVDGRRNVTDAESLKLTLIGSPENLQNAIALIEDVLKQERLVKISVPREEQWEMLMSRSRNLSQRMGDGVRASLRRTTHVVVLHGEPDAVTVAQEKLLNELKEWVSEELELSNTLLRGVIGKKGTRIHAIEKESGARLRTEKGSSTLRIQGSSQQVAVARQLVDDFIAGEQSEVTELSSELFGAVVGKAGSNIKHIEKESGARVTLNRDCGQVSVKGTTEQRRTALDMIAETLRSAPISRVVELQERELSYLIGPNGATAHAFEDASGTRLHFDRNRCSVAVRGATCDVEKALVVLEDDRQRIQVHQIEFLPSEDPRDVLDAFLGAGRKYLRAFEDLHAVKVSVETSENYFHPSYFVIMGGVCDADVWPSKIAALEEELEIAENEVRGIPRPSEAVEELDYHHDNDEEDEEKDEEEQEPLQQRAQEPQPQQDDEDDDEDEPDYDPADYSLGLSHDVGLQQADDEDDEDDDDDGDQLKDANLVSVSDDEVVSDVEQEGDGNATLKSEANVDVETVNREHDEDEVAAVEPDADEASMSSDMDIENDFGEVPPAPFDPRARAADVL